MKYWRKLNGDCGMVDDKGYVPDSVEIVKYDYDQFVAGQVMVIHPKTDGERLIEYAKVQGWI